MIRPAAVSYDPGDLVAWRDPYPVYQRLRDEDPVHHVSERGFWVLSRFADVMGAACDTAHFSSAQGLTFNDDEIAQLGLLPTLVMMDKPQHTVYRRLVNVMFTPRAVAERQAALRSFIRDRVAALAALGQADFVAEVATPVPSFVVASYLGVPDQDRSTFGRWSSAIVQANASGSIMAAGQALTELYGYFTDLIEWRRSHGGADMISGLLEAEIDGRAVSTEEILGFCFVMIAGGNDTAAGLLSGTAALLSEHPDQRRWLAADLSRVPGAVEELLRFTSPVQGLSRTTTTEVALGGDDHRVVVPPGTKVHLLYGSANRDPREFGAQADRLDLRRTVARTMAFGSGPHHCLGAAAARLQGRLVIEEMVATIPTFVVDSEGARLAPGPFTRRYQFLPITTTA
jgi:cytochrome P450 family 130